MKLTQFRALLTSFFTANAVDRFAAAIANIRCLRAKKGEKIVFEKEDFYLTSNSTSFRQKNHLLQLHDYNQCQNPGTFTVFSSLEVAKYRKILVISPGLIQLRKGFWVGL